MNRQDTDVLIGGADPLDTRLSDAAGTVPRSVWWWRTRPALGLAPTPMPSFVLLLSGLALGPDGLAVLSPRVLAVLDPVTSIGLAALGVLIGLSLTPDKRDAARGFAVGSLETVATVLAIGLAVVLAADVWLVNVAWSAPAIALLAVCASPSAARGTDAESETAVAGSYGDLPAILLGGFTMTWLVEPSAAAVLWLTVNTVGIAAVSAIAGWLLVGEAATESEQRVFAAGTLLLLGGAAVYLSSAVLLLGVMAGIVWGVAGGLSRDRIVRDVSYVQHPFVVLLLLVAGASIDLSADAFALALLIAVTRVGAKLAGIAVASRTLAPELQIGGGMRLIAPGAVGIGLALGATNVPGLAEGQLLLSVVVTSVIVSDVLALLVAPNEGAA
jgi:hypothetical protein